MNFCPVNMCRRRTSRRDDSVYPARQCKAALKMEFSQIKPIKFPVRSTDPGNLIMSVLSVQHPRVHPMVVDLNGAWAVCALRSRL
jgi:hypothetical protein